MAFELSVGGYRVSVNAEGWYRDPFQVHGDRWFSDGTPTNVVRDGDVEGYDDPPADRWDGALVDIDENNSMNGDDLRRADDPSSHQYSKREATDAAFDSVAAFGGGFG